MENASKALSMTASILIGLIILSFGIYLVNTFKNFSQDYNESLEIQRMQQFNAEFSAFSTRKNVSIHEIVTLTNFAKEFNEVNQIQPGENQFINVNIIYKDKSKSFNLSNENNFPKSGSIRYDNYDLFINSLLDGTYIKSLYGNSTIEDGRYKYDYDENNKKKIYYNCYECKGYTINDETGRVETITFEFIQEYHT